MGYAVEVPPLWDRIREIAANSALSWDKKTIIIKNSQDLATRDNYNVLEAFSCAQALTRNVEAFLEKTAIAYRQNVAFFSNSSGMQQQSFLKTLQRCEYCTVHVWATDTRRSLSRDNNTGSNIRIVYRTSSWGTDQSIRLVFYHKQGSGTLQVQQSYKSTNVITLNSLPTTTNRRNYSRISNLLPPVALPVPTSALL